MDEEIVTTTTTTTVTVRRHVGMDVMRRKLKLPPIKRNWIKKKKAKGMSVEEYVGLFCALNHYKD